jgi:hypothetical protein
VVRLLLNRDRPDDSKKIIKSEPSTACQTVACHDFLSSHPRYCPRLHAQTFTPSFIEANGFWRCQLYMLSAGDSESESRNGPNGRFSELFINNIPTPSLRIPWWAAGLPLFFFLFSRVAATAMLYRTWHLFLGGEESELVEKIISYATNLCVLLCFTLMYMYMNMIPIQRSLYNRGPVLHLRAFDRPTSTVCTSLTAPSIQNPT